MRTRGLDVKGKWKLVTEYPNTEYKCGIRAGEMVTLRKEFSQRSA